MRVDLHIHSTYSDGIRTPEELVEIALKLNLAAISIADHDCLDGTEACASAARRNGLEMVSGVELSSEYLGRDLHILGYGIDPKDQRFQEMLQRFRDTRQKRGLKILKKLKNLGLPLDEEILLAKSPEGSLGRPHIAEALFEKGYVQSYVEAFDRYLGEDGPAYVKKYKLRPDEAVEHIHAAGGLAFIAHPAFLLPNIEDLLELIKLGFDGLEVAHPNQSEHQRAELEELADLYGLLVSGGSDYHGITGKDHPIGEPEVPYEVFARIMEKLRK